MRQDLESACKRETDTPPRVDVLIVGCGPVGALLALLLGRLGIRVLVVDKSEGVYMAPRAIALDNEALRILQAAGVGQTDLDTVGIPSVRMHCPMIGEFARINTLGQLDGHPKLVTFYQPDLEHLLRDRLDQHENIALSLGTELSGFAEDAEGVKAFLKRKSGGTVELHCSWLVGADGAASTVRQLLGTQFAGETYAEEWLIVDSRSRPKPIDHIEFVCDYKRPHPHMCAPGNRERWEFKLRPGEMRAEMESDTRIRELLKPWGELEVMEIERKAVYRFHARVAKAFSRGRVFLVGDSAHVTPPFVGQGLVSGMRDAFNLAWKLAFVVKGLAATGILESYDRERRPHATAMINLAKLMGRIVMPRNAVLSLLIHGVMRLIQGIPIAKTYFQDLKIKPRAGFRSGLFLKAKSSLPFRPGELFPQGLVRGRDGEIVLSDDVLGDGLTLVSLGFDAMEALDPEISSRFFATGGKLIEICHCSQKRHLAVRDAWEDLESRFLSRQGSLGLAFLVRPDRVVLAAATVERIDDLLRDSFALLKTPESIGSYATKPLSKVA